MTLSPQQRLAATRRAIVQSMGRDREAHSSDDMPDVSQAETGFDGHATFKSAADSARSARRHSSGLNGLWRTVRRATSTWWRSHPAHLAVDVVHPVFEKYAQEHPLKLVGAAAAVGAVLVIAKPWRLISVTGLLMAALRSTQISSLIAPFLASQPER